MGADDAESRFAINLDSNVDEVGAQAASELEQLRQRIAGSTDAVKRMTAANRALRGSTDEVKAAKESLKARIDAERNSISADNLALLKHGTTYDQVAEHAKKLEAEKRRLDAQLKSHATIDATASTDAMANAVKLAGGPVSDIMGRFSALDGVLGEAGGAMGGVVLAAAGAATAIAALTGVVVSAAVALGKFIVTNADVARSMNLVREAATGSATNARNLGDQIDVLRQKVPLSEDALNKLGVTLARTRLSGPAIVDALNAVGQASAAMGDDVGHAIQGIITRGQMWNRFQLNPLDLEGTGLKFGDVAAALAGQLKIGVKDAQLALREGRVKLDDGAKAMREALEKRFGPVNARLMLGLTEQAKLFEDILVKLTKDVNIEPLLDGVSSLVHLFDDSTVAGWALKDLVTTIGNQIGPGFQSAVPMAQALFEYLVLGALDAEIAFLRLRGQLRPIVGEVGKVVDAVSRVGEELDAAFGGGETAGIGALTASLGLAEGALKSLDLLLHSIATSLSVVGNVIHADWKGAGASIASGVASGITEKAGAVTGAVKGLAGDVKAAFANALQIHSPSRVMFGMGGSLPEGAAGGVRARTGLVVRAVEDMGADAAAAGDLEGGAAGGGYGGGSALARTYETPSTSRAPSGDQGGGGGSSGGITVDVGGITIEVKGGDGKVAEQLTSASFLAQLTKAMREAIMAAGVPTQGAT